MSGLAHMGRVGSVNISTEKGEPKKPVDEAMLDARGIEGDAHAGPWHRQVSLLGQDSIDRFIAMSGRETSPGEFAENITVEGIDLVDVSPLDVFQVGEEAELLVTQIGKKCHGDACAIYREVGKCVMPKEGLFAQVAKPGAVKRGDVILHFPYTLRCRIITLSDRAFLGEYEDRSGPTIKGKLLEHFEPTPWRMDIVGEMLPDDAARLEQSVREVVKSGHDIIITTGGTGLGPKDITPEVIRPMFDKEIPGIMDHVRLKYGAEKPGALLSRAIAGVIGTTLVFCLPGSVRAVNEYMTEILTVLEHLLFTVHGIDRHG